MDSIIVAEEESGEREVRFIVSVALFVDKDKRNGEIKMDWY